MNITWFLVIIFVMLINNTNDKHGTIKYKTQYINYILLLELLITSGYSINAIIWSIINSENIFSYFKNYIYMPQWLNMIMYILEIVVNFITVIVVFYVIQRIDKARIVLLKVLPILSITFVYDFIRRLQDEMLLNENVPIYVTLGLIFIFGILPYMIIYYFYSRNSIKEKLFISK